MEKICYPARSAWPSLQRRPAQDMMQLGNLVREIFDAVAREGDAALLQYSRRYDHSNRTVLKLSDTEVRQASDQTPPELRSAIDMAAGNIRRFHEAQRDMPREIYTQPGVCCWRESRAIEKAGLYIPGGSAPLCSTVLMLAIPAQLAGCREIILCTPPQPDGALHPAICYAAAVTGVTAMYAVGGIQAIAGMASGTGSIPKVDKLFGPGNAYVTAAKQHALSLGTAIDMPAGPSEVLIIADDSCTPAFVAADLLSQAEHGPDSQVLLLSDSEKVIDAVLAALQLQLAQLPREKTAREALTHSYALLFEDKTQAFAFSDGYAPEHLILAMDGARQYLPWVSNAGSVFLGHYSCESAGDYASGTNHTLPTNGYARSYSGISLDSFLKKISVQEISREGLELIGPAIETMAEAEALFAHKNAVTLRRNS